MGLDRYLMIGSAVAGLVHGFSDAQGIPLNESVEFGLTYGPAIVRGAIQGIEWGVIGASGGAMLGGVGGYSRSGRSLDTVIGTTIGATGGGVTSGAIGGGVGVVKGGIQTLIGYGIGYVAGYLTR